MTYARQVRSFLVLPDLSRTFYLQATGIRDTQHRARFLTFWHEVRLCRQALDVGACIVPGHGSIRVSKECLAIFHRHAHRAQPTCEMCRKSCRYDRAARTRTARTTSRVPLMVVAQMPEATRSLTKRAVP